jgi:putative transposase
MPRTKRFVIPGVAHHITQRGNNRSDVFFTDADREFYLSILLEQSRAYGLSISAYCLMTNHIHLVAIPQTGESLAKAVGRTHVIYAQAINRLHSRSGHLWQGRFHSCAMDEDHTWRAARYVERNPVRAGMCRYPWDWKWSSAAAHVTGEDSSGLLDMSLLAKDFAVDEWKAILSDKRDAKKDMKVFRVRSGRPLGTDSFLSKMEALMGFRLRALPRGRPKKESKEK